MTNVVDVIVVGCGPVGAAAANLFATRGLTVAVVEPNIAPYALPRAIHFDHEIMRILQSAGLAERLLPLLHVPAGAMTFGGDLAPIRPFRPGAVQPALGWAASYFYRQPEIEAAMRAALRDRPNVTLWLGAEATAITADANGVTVEVAGSAPSVLRGRYLVACDGARSMVRKAIDVPLDDLDFDEPWIVVDALVDAPVVLPPLRDTPPGVDMRDVMFTIADPARPMSYIPSAGQHRRWEFMLLPGETADDFATPERVAALIEPWMPGGGWRPLRQAIYRFHALIAQRWRVGRVFLAGDAAHQTPPFFGQGLCHGIRDVANLAWKLDAVLHRGADDALLASYEAERMPQVRAIIAASVRMGRYICTLDPAAAARRDLELRRTDQPPPPPMDLIPPLTTGVVGRRSPPAGSRFIQPAMTRDKRVALLDDLSGGGFVLLTTVGSPVMIPPALQTVGLRSFIVASDATNDSATLIDHTGQLMNWLGQWGAVGVIVRPDAYVYDIFTTPEEARACLASLSAALDLAPSGDASIHAAPPLDSSTRHR